MSDGGDWRVIRTEDYLGEERAARLSDLRRRARENGLIADEMAECLALSDELARKVRAEMEARARATVSPEAERLRAARAAVSAWVKEEGLGKGGEWTADMIRDVLLVEAAVLWPLLQECALAYDALCIQQQEARR